MYPGAYLTTTPDKPAAMVAETGEQITFRELEHQSIQIARYLRNQGLRRGDTIALIATNTLAVFGVYWAGMRSGLYVTAINCHLTAPEAAYIATDCGAKAIFVDARLGALGNAISDETDGVDLWLSLNGSIDGFIDLDTATSHEPTDPLPDQPTGADMLYSSGTTGCPKGIKVDLPDRQIHEPGDPTVDLNRTLWNCDSETIYLSPAPLYHAGPLRFSTAIQALGGTAVIMDHFEPEAALAAIEKYQVNHSQWVPTMFVRMLKLPQETRDRYDVSSLRSAVHAAAPCPVDIKRRMINWWGPIISEYYSATEAPGVTFTDSHLWLAKPGTVGTAVIGTLRICDGTGAELPPGQIGTVYFERDELPFEYHNAPEKTRKAQHPHHPTWTTTGDVGYVDDDGALFLTDRGSFMIISGGVNIYPQEIENALIEHPKVLDAGVIGIPDDDMGEIVMAIIEPLDTASTDGLDEEIRDYLRKRLAPYKLPRRIEFTSQLPRTPTGKLVKRQLVDRYRTPSTKI